MSVVYNLYLSSFYTPISRPSLSDQKSDLSDLAYSFVIPTVI